jgi:hypothetical protein
VAPTRLRRPLAALLVLALAALVFVVAGPGEAPRKARTTLAARALDPSPPISFRVDAAAQQAITWRGGPVTASTGEIVRVFVSNSIPLEVTTPEAWGELLSGLTHGPELASLTTRIAPIAEVQEICGPRTLGCYGPNEMIAPSEPASDGTPPEEVLRHEYGHHIAFHRQNPPWRAIEWGPKHWASVANVCARAARDEVFPGGDGRNYALNPGEGWAEVYRLMDERRAGITTATWPIVSQSFYPSEAALQAAERDVLTPWTAGRTLSFRRTFGGRATRPWWIRLATPLDGDLRLTATVPRGGLHEVALFAGNRTTVLQRGQWVSQRAKRLSRVVCGQRSLFVRVTPRGTAGQVRVTVSAP